MNYREQRAYLNCEKQIFSGVGGYDFPEIKPAEVDFSGAELLGFNYAIQERHPENKIVHFHLDDYQFERVWSTPDRYLEILSRFKAVLSPDFSMYTDFPRVVQMFNHYRKQWCGAYWQEHGINVIPTVGWSDKDSWEWCFDGVPKNSLVSISTIGSQKNPEVRREFCDGFMQALRELEPEKILLIGKKYPWIPLGKWEGKVIVMQSPNLLEKERKSIRKERA